jgi:hypothetical protein
MGLCPPSRSSDRGVGRWHDANVGGTPVTLDQLRGQFPEDNNWGAVSTLSRDVRGFTVLGRKGKGNVGATQLLAYECGSCGSMYRGPPEIKDEEIGDNPLAGRRGYDLYCYGCGELLDSRTIANS